VALPNAFFAADGLLQTMRSVLGAFEAFPAVIARELETYLPFLATSKILMAAVTTGAGRETAHAAIKEHAVAVARAMRETGTTTNDLIARLAGDKRLGLTEDDLTTLVHADPASFTGLAMAQTDAFLARADKTLAKYPGAAASTPGTVL
jgi:adenylosuccinate lyase